MAETLSAADYVILAILLLMSGVIGLVVFLLNRKKSSDHVFTGSGKMTLLPISMTLFAAFISASGMIGVPAEINLFGSSVCFELVGYAIAGVITCTIFIPFYYRLGYTSLYLYVEDRFNNRVISVMMSIFYILQMFLYMSIVLYGPSSAVSTATGLSLEISIVATGLICTFYTAAGGIVAVMWNDVYQSFLMISGLITMLVVGFVSVGFTNVFEIASAGGRLADLIYPIIKPNPFQRQTFWSVILGSFCLQLSLFSGNQASFQRYSSCVTLNTARLGLIIGFTCFILFWIGLYLLGYITYAYFSCDPLLSKQITETTQIVPIFVMEAIGPNGGAGFITASILGASLTTLAAGMNAVATVFTLNIVVPIRKWMKKPDFADRTLTYTTMALTGISGAITIGLAFVTRYLGDVISQIVVTIFGIIGAPLLGVVICAIFIPRINWIGATIGMWTGLIITLWLDIGSIVTNVSSYTPLPPRTDNCSDNLKPTSPPSYTTTTAPFDDFNDIYRLSFQLYGPIALVSTITVAFFVSLCSDFHGKIRPKPELTYWGHVEDSNDSSSEGKPEDMENGKVNPSQSVEMSELSNKAVEGSNNAAFEEDQVADAVSDQSANDRKNSVTPVAVGVAVAEMAESKIDTETEAEISGKCLDSQEDVVQSNRSLTTVEI